MLIGLVIDSAGLLLFRFVVIIKELAVKSTLYAVENKVDQNVLECIFRY